MTERIVRMLAKENAGAFYEQKRSKEFREGGQLVVAYRDWTMPDGRVVERPCKIPFSAAFPTVQHYVRAWWPHFVELAVKQLAAMLAMPDGRISPHLKEQIGDALREHYARSRMPGAQCVHQQTLEMPNEL